VQALDAGWAAPQKLQCHCDVELQTNRLIQLHASACTDCSRGLAAIGSKSSRAKLQDDEKTVTLQVGRSVFADAPRNMRTELWMSSLQRKGIGVAASQRYHDMLQTVRQHAAVLLPSLACCWEPQAKQYVLLVPQQASMDPEVCSTPEAIYWFGCATAAAFRLQQLP
jgi:hypothetical protein